MASWTSVFTSDIKSSSNSFCSRWHDILDALAKYVDISIGAPTVVLETKVVVYYCVTLCVLGWTMVSAMILSIMLLM